MIKITVTKKAYPGDEEFDYDLNAEISIPDDATMMAGLYAFVKAMKIEGYNGEKLEKILDAADKLDNK